MASAQSVMTLVVLAALFCLPPTVSLVACLRQIAAVRRTGRGTAWPVAGAVVAAAAILVNLGIVGATAWAARGGAPKLDSSHAIAALLSWLCFWIWIALLVFGRRRHHRKAD